MRTHKIAALVLALVITATLASTALASGGDDRAAHPTATSPDPRPGDGGSTPTSTTTVLIDATPDDVAFASPSTPTMETGPSTPEPTGSIGPAVDQPSPSRPTGPIGELADEGLVPAAFGVVVPTQQGGSSGHSASDSLAAAPSCSHQCITKGVAYLHGSGVELVIETSVPAQLYISVVADLDHDGSYESNWVETTAFGYSSYSWVLEGLTAGETYYAMVAATDDNFDTSYAWGEFTLP